MSVPRSEGKDKVCGTAKYVGDFSAPGLLHAQLVTSPYAHATIKSIDVSGAWAITGVLGIVTGEEVSINCGPILEDRPPLARGKVRYAGEPVAVVVAVDEMTAWLAVDAIKVDYEELPLIKSIREARQTNATLIHEKLSEYRKVQSIDPVPGTNIASHTKIRKGDLEPGWQESEVRIECEYSLPQSAHAFLETRSCRVEIKPDGQVFIHTATQGPHFIKKSLSRYFHLDEGKITVVAPLVGGAYGGKTADQLEIIGYLASQAVGGRAVKLVNTRENDLTTSPCHIGFEATVKLGCTKQGKLTVAELEFFYDGGAYTDTGPTMARAGAAQCTGPYSIPNVRCDSYCVYTNHVYTTAFRGFGHTEFTFAIERTIDQLARQTNIDPLEFRLLNCVTPGDLTPTEVVLNNSNIGDLTACLNNLRSICKWEEGHRQQLANGKIRAKGISCFWKNSSSPPNAASGALLTFNQDGSINLNCGLVEIGQGTKTALAQVLAEKFSVGVDKIHVAIEVDTRFSPLHWKTVASMGLYMAGRAVLSAADDAITQLRRRAATVLKCEEADLNVGGGTVYLRDNPTIHVQIAQIANGYEYPDGNSIGGPVLGRGGFIMRHLSEMDKETGAGQPGPYWTVGAEAVEVEFAPEEFTYKITKAAVVIDAGKIINPLGARGQVMGAMAMGLSLGSREGYEYSNEGIMHIPRLRTYELMRFGEQPEYEVSFVETPLLDGPYGARGVGEHGIVGITAALANSLSVASGAELCLLPLTPETIWRAKKEKQNDSL